MRRKKYFLFAAIAALLVSCGKGNMKFGDNEYPVRAVDTQSATTETTYPATVKGIHDVEIRPKLAGLITQVCVKEGQAVQAGQLLFVIDNSTYQAAVKQAAAVLNTAKAQMNTARLTYNNNKQLFDSHVIGQYELQSAENTYTSAQAAVAQAKANLSSAKETLGFCFVKSPATGVIGSLPYKVGAYVSATSVDPLTTVSDTKIVEVFFSMTESDIFDMTKSAGKISTVISDYPPVKLQIADGSIYDHPGKVVKVSGVINQSTGAVSMIAHFDNPDKLLRSGGTGSIIVPHNTSSSIVIPQQWVMEVQDKFFVYTLGKSNKVRYTEITVDPQNDGLNYIVTGGLHVGDKVVTNGITKLTDGMEIKPITEAQYAKKIADATQLGSIQGDYSKMRKAFK